ncbi:MAG: hypothetical protein QM724_01545 [Flavobacteriales bacterium]
MSTSGGGGLRKRLDEAVVLHATVMQLGKDLNADLDLPPVGEEAFERLRAQVLTVLEERQRRGAHAFGLVLNRVDLTEGAFRQAMDAGGLDELSARIVLRCLQKVLARERFAGRG